MWCCQQWCGATSLSHVAAAHCLFVANNTTHTHAGEGCWTGRADAEWQQVQHYANWRGSAAAAAGRLGLRISEPPLLLLQEQLVPLLSSHEKHAACTLSGCGHVFKSHESVLSSRSWDLFHALNVKRYTMDITALLLRACAARSDPSPTQLVKPALFQSVTHVQRNSPLILVTSNTLLLWVFPPLCRAQTFCWCRPLVIKQRQWLCSVLCLVWGLQRPSCK